MKTLDQAGMDAQKTPEREKSRIFVSKDWTPEERKSLIDLMNKEIKELDAKETKLRATIHWEAPGLKEIDEKRKGIQDLIDKLGDEVPSEFLEANRQNFEKFVL